MIDLLETERIKSEIAEQPQNVQSIIETSGEIGICITNDKGNFVAVNDAYTKIYGYGKTELVGKSFLIVVPESNRENMTHLHDKFIRDKREIARSWQVVDKAGRVMSISVDTAYSDQIFDKSPHKITFVHKES